MKMTINSAWQLCVFAFLFSSQFLFSSIQEISRFSEVLEYVDDQTFVFLDVDDTLIQPAQMLGNDTWFEYRYKQNKMVGIESPLEKTLAEWEAIRHLSKMVLVEPEISEVIQKLQESNTPVMGLTAQGLALATRTVLQLKEHQIDLTKSALFPEDVCISLQGHTLLYRGGILFASGKSKGESLMAFFNKMGVLPKRIVVVDDKLSNLDSVVNTLGDTVEIVGLRYSYLDGYKESFSPEIAQIQLKHSTLLHLFSDEEARNFLEGESLGLVASF